MRKRLIKWLGGYSAEEMAQTTEKAAAESYDLGTLHAFTAVKLRMQECNGMDASEWCSSMWEFIMVEQQRLEKEVKP